MMVAESSRRHRHHPTSLDQGMAMHLTTREGPRDSRVGFQQHWISASLPLEPLSHPDSHRPQQLHDVVLLQLQGCLDLLGLP